MPENLTLVCRPRTILGKKVKQLRRQGELPGIVYGPVIQDPRPVSVNAVDFEQVYRHTGGTALIDLTVDGDTHTVIIREVAREPVKKAILHIDFYAPSLDRMLDTSIPIVTVGDVPGILDGILTHHRSDVLVRALPRDMPQQLEVDLSRLSDDVRVILVGDVVVPTGVELLTPADEIVISVDAQAAEKVVAPDAQDVLAEQTGDRPAEMRPDSGPTREPR
ncbi:MAG TPA: 50S ribosomal protein L25 [Thermomicrobiaceae bacterium]|nr:50S ribosomal protein L25 [Thermomicrobiaceae bacterium]